MMILINGESSNIVFGKSFYWNLPKPQKGPKIDSQLLPTTKFEGSPNGNSKELKRNLERLKLEIFQRWWRNHNIGGTRPGPEISFFMIHQHLFSASCYLVYGGYWENFKTGRRKKLEKCKTYTYLSCFFWKRF